MLLEELQERLNTIETVEEQLQHINPIYYLLDFEKDDFCKLINAIGIEKWLEKSDRWKRLYKAEEELDAKRIFPNTKYRFSAPLGRKPAFYHFTCMAKSSRSTNQVSLVVRQWAY